MPKDFVVTLGCLQNLRMISTGTALDLDLEVTTCAEDRLQPVQEAGWVGLARLLL